MILVCCTNCCADNILLLGERGMLYELASKNIYYFLSSFIIVLPSFYIRQIIIKISIVKHFCEQEYIFISVIIEMLIFGLFVRKLRHEDFAKYIKK